MPAACGRTSHQQALGVGAGRADLARLDEADVICPDDTGLAIDADVVEAEVVGLGDQGPGPARVLALDGVDATDVVQIERPELDRDRVAEAAGEDLFDLGKVAVLELELGVIDPLRSLSDKIEHGAG